MNTKYEVHTYIEMKVATFIYANSEKEAIAIACEKDADSFLKDQILDISTVKVNFACEC
jgi:hypothetical protein